MNPSFEFAIDLPIRSEWANVELVRTSLENCLAAVFHDVDGRQTIATVVGELLENAIKYGEWGSGESSFRLRTWGGGTTAWVVVENPVRPDDDNVAELFEILAWLRTFPSPEEAFRAKLLAAAQDELEPDASGLGLARIAYEGNCAIGAEIDGSWLRVSAKLDLRAA